MPSHDTTQFTLHDAASRILEEAHIVIDDPDVRDQMVEDIVESISNRINVGMVQALTAEKQAEFDTLIQAAASPEEIQEFFSANIKNIPDIISTAILEVRNRYLSE